MKKKLIIFFVTIIGIASLCFVGCEGGKITKSLADFSGYKELDIDRVTRIHAIWDEGGGRCVEYDIVDKNDLRNIVSFLVGEDSFMRISHSDHDCYRHSIVLYDGETRLAEVPLGHIKDGADWFEYSTPFVYNYVRLCGENMDYFRGFFGLEEKGDIDLNDIQKVKVYIQEGEDWQSPTYIKYDICEEENVGFIVEALTDRKAFITMNQPWESNDLSYIEIYDGAGGCVTVMLDYGRHKLLATGVYNFIRDYGLTNGYLQK